MISVVGAGTFLIVDHHSSFFGVVGEEKISFQLFKLDVGLCCFVLVEINISGCDKESFHQAFCVAC